MAAKGYDDAGRQKRAAGYLEHLSKHFDLRGKRVLEIGPYMGDLSIALTSEFDCEVVGIDPLEHPVWGEVQRRHPRIRMVHGDIANPPDDLGDNFDYIFSFVVWEHIRNPWSALQTCQRVLKPTGKKLLRANLYRSAIASHLYNEVDEPWPHLMYSPDEIVARFPKAHLGWAFWVNKLTYQQYLFYFRQLGMYVTHEHFWQTRFDPEYYSKNEHRLGLYPEWDLRTDFFEVILEFDRKHPKKPIPDPVYRLDRGS